MSYGKERPDPAGGWEGLAEWTGGQPPEEIQALAAVRPLEAVHSLLRGLAGRNPRELLIRAAVLESLSSARTSPDEAIAWLTGPGREEVLLALRSSGWLDPDPAGPLVLTALGRQVWGSLRHAASPKTRAAAPPLLPEGITAEQIARALLTWSVDALAEAGRGALVPILPALPFVNTEAVARAAESQARAAEGQARAKNSGRSGKPGDNPVPGRTAAGRTGGSRRR